MDVSDLILAAGAGMVCLAISATLWALVARGRAQARVDVLRAQLSEMEYASASALASTDSDGTALVTHDHGNLTVTSGREAAAACARALGCDNAPSSLVLALRRQNPQQLDKLERLFGKGEPFAFE